MTLSTYPANNQNISKNNTPSSIENLQKAIVNIIRYSNSPLSNKINKHLEKIKTCAGYYSYTDQKQQNMGHAIKLWKNFGDDNNFVLPISLEDELAIIFYIYISHDDPERKSQILADILISLELNPIDRENILKLCHTPPLKKEPIDSF